MRTRILSQYPIRLLSAGSAFVYLLHSKNEDSSTYDASRDVGDKHHSFGDIHQ
jgi:hypothetical protein